MMRRKGESRASWFKRVATRNRTMARSPGHHWRILAHGKGESFEVKGRRDLCFDELVIDHWLHIEQMDSRVWWMRVGDAVLWVTVQRSGNVRVSVEAPPEGAEVWRGTMRNGRLP